MSATRKNEGKPAYWFLNLNSSLSFKFALEFWPSGEWIITLLVAGSSVPSRLSVCACFCVMPDRSSIVGRVLLPRVSPYPHHCIISWISSQWNVPKLIIADALENIISLQRSISCIKLYCYVTAIIKLLHFWKHDSLT